MGKTEIKIDKAILHRTTDCLFDFNCLSVGQTCICDVVASNEEDIVEIKSKPSIPCKYCVSLESASYYTCPTRVEIYIRYEI